MQNFHGRWMLLAAVLIAQVACSKPNPEPELLDPIYGDLTRRAAEAKKSLEDEQKKQAELRGKLEHSEPHSLELKNAARDLQTSQASSLELQQTARYYEIRADRRKFEDRLEYKVAFDKGEKWPNPKDYSDYLVNTRLRSASKNWSARVPKLQDRLSTAAKSPEKEKGSEEKAE